MPYGGEDKAACRGLVPPSTLRILKFREDGQCLVSRCSIWKWVQILSTFFDLFVSHSQGNREMHDCGVNQSLWFECLSVLEDMYCKQHISLIIGKEDSIDMLNNQRRQSAQSFSPKCSADGRAAHWVRYLTGDYANAQSGNRESCLQSPETNPCAIPHYITFLTSLTPDVIVL